MNKYDMHTHTLYSNCSNMKPEVILKTAKKRGLNGIAVTDHNTIKGGLAVKRLNNDKNFEVIVGAEIYCDKAEILGYYLNEEIKPGKVEEVVEKIHEQGGIAVVSHPFTHALIRKKLEFDVKKIKIDGVEVFNARNIFASENEKALALAKKYNLSQIGSSDAHFSYEIGRGYTLFEGDFREAVRKRKTRAEGGLAILPIGRVLSFVKRII